MAIDHGNSVERVAILLKAMELGDFAHQEVRFVCQTAVEIKIQDRTENYADYPNITHLNTAAKVIVANQKG